MVSTEFVLRGTPGSLGKSHSENKKYSIKVNFRGRSPGTAFRKLYDLFAVPIKTSIYLDNKSALEKLLEKSKKESLGRMDLLVAASLAGKIMEREPDSAVLALLVILKSPAFSSNDAEVVQSAKKLFVKIGGNERLLGEKLRELLLEGNRNATNAAGALAIWMLGQGNYGAGHDAAGSALRVVTVAKELLMDKDSTREGKFLAGLVFSKGQDWVGKQLIFIVRINSELPGTEHLKPVYVELEQMQKEIQAKKEG